MQCKLILRGHLLDLTGVKAETLSFSTHQVSIDLTIASRVLQEEIAEISEEKEHRSGRASPASSSTESIRISRSRRRKVTPRWSAFLVSPIYIRTGRNAVVSPWRSRFESAMRVARTRSKRFSARVQARRAHAARVTRPDSPYPDTISRGREKRSC